MKYFLAIIALAAVVVAQEAIDNSNYFDYIATPLSSVEVRSLLDASQPGTDYPILNEIPETGFTCGDRRGFYADTDPASRCQVIRRCTYPDGDMYSYLCPNQTLFNNIFLTCGWFFDVNCAVADSIQEFANRNLYKDPDTKLHRDIPDNYIPAWWIQAEADSN